MTSRRVPRPGECGACEGRGWKFVSLRRPVSTAAGAAESGPVKRRRALCLECGGTRLAKPAPKDFEPYYPMIRGLRIRGFRWPG
jgi:hypothetical protein